VVALSLIVGGVILWVLESIPRRSDTSGFDKVTIRQCLIVGVVQITALVPGVSRSGSTIVGAMLAGMDRRTATAFSFYLSIPTLGIATLYAVARSLDVLAGGVLLDIVIGLVVSFVTALAAIHWLLRFISRNSFKGFAVYRVVAGVAILAMFA
jgi:undecaprenyl-diphosphatase